MVVKTNTIRLELNGVLLDVPITEYMRLLHETVASYQDRLHNETYSNNKVGALLGARFMDMVIGPDAIALLMAASRVVPMI